MPGKVKVKILAGRNLPVMDRSSDTTDAYVEVKLGNTTFKTDVCRKSLNPQWNTEWYRFEVDDSELQDEPLQIRLMDHDTYSANDAIGKVYLDLNPLLLPVAIAANSLRSNDGPASSSSLAGGNVMSGWIPVYDTMHGIRGEVNVIVKVELFSDFNKFRQSSCGVQFFCSGTIPQGYHAPVIHGFVEELVVNDDPEYQWIDKIRTPRASNEARQTLFFKLSGEVQRKIGLKALDLGGNAVIGYYQCFDLEGESGIVVRGIGTAVTLIKHQEISLPPLDTMGTEDMPLFVTNASCSNTAASAGPQSPRFCVIPPSLPLSPEKSATRMGVRFPGVTSAGVKMNKKKLRVKIIPPYMASGSRNKSAAADHPQGHTTGWATRSLTNPTSEEAQALRDLIEQEETPRGNRFSRGLKAIGFTKRMNALRAKLSPGISSPGLASPGLMSPGLTSPMPEDDTESDNSCSSGGSRSRRGSLKKTRFKFVRKHKRSSSDSMATTLVLSLMGNNLDRVVEVRESPNSSPSSPQRQSLSTDDYLRVPVNECVPELMYVDGHLVSNNSSGVSSSSESPSSSEEDDEEGLEEFLPQSTSPSPEVLSRAVHDAGTAFSFPVVETNPTIACTELAIIYNVPEIYVIPDDLPSPETRPNGLNPERGSSLEGSLSNKATNESNNSTKPCTELAIIYNVPEIHITPDDLPKKESDTDCPSRVTAPIGSKEKLDDSVLVLDDAPSSLNIPMCSSPLHKSKSASALVELPHDTVTNIDRHAPCLLPSNRPITELDTEDEANENMVNASSVAVSATAPKMAALPAIHRRSSDSDLSITPKGNSLTGTGSDRSMGTHLRPAPAMVRPSMNQESLDMLEYPFLTMTTYPPGFILHLGGCVSSRSVKLLERITNLDEPESRDIWWTELRLEVRSHARALGCNVVLGYSEQTSICDDICILSASGTAAVISLQYSGRTGDSSSGHVVPRTHLGLQHKELMTTSLDRTDFERDKSSKPPDIQIPVTPGSKVRPPSCDIPEVEQLPCTACHIPYSETSVPFRVTMIKCAVCKLGKVPDVLFTTIELLDSLPTTGKGCFIQAYTIKAKRDSHGELNATEISDGLPFLEYELHRLLVNKLKVKGMNAIFKLKVQVSIGEKLLVGLATGTAVFLTALPAPPVPKITAGKSWTDDKKLVEMQKLIQDTVKSNKEVYQLNKSFTGADGDFPLLMASANGRASEDDESEDDIPELDLATGNKDTCVLEIDDAEDIEVVSLMIDPPAPKGFYVVSTETVPGLDNHEVVRNLQMFTQLWRAKIPLSQNQQGQCQNPLPNTYSQHFQGMLQSVFFKLRRMSPCALCDLQFKVMMSEADEIQLSVYGMALGLGESERPGKHKKRLQPMKKSDDNDLMFSLEEDQAVDNAAAFKARPYSPFRARTYSNSLPHHTAPSERYGVDLTPLSYVPGGKIERYLGNLNFFFIRESTSVREGGGLSGFIHSFLTEVLAIVRAHVTALGGNAMVAYFVSECVLYHNQHKNQGQCLINVGGDVVFVSYKG